MPNIVNWLPAQDRDCSEVKQELRISGEVCFVFDTEDDFV
jgi:hypothetical protein